jgi:uncharacterized protein YfaP (DUF2135 family)
MSDFELIVNGVSMPSAIECRESVVVLLAFGAGLLPEPVGALHVSSWPPAR